MYDANGNNDILSVLQCMINVEIDGESISTEYTEYIYSIKPSFQSLFIVRSISSSKL